MSDIVETDAEENLRTCQRQLDMDGVEVGVSRQALEETFATIAQLRAEVERLTALTSGWSAHDEPLPEDAEIDACHPLKSKDHEGYMEAMRMVGAKRSKGALVNLVHWLLFRIDRLNRYHADGENIEWIRSGTFDRLQEEIAEHKARADKAEAAIRWALGEEGDFQPRGEGDPAYWWRKELRRLARGEVT